MILAAFVLLIAYFLFSKCIKSIIVDIKSHKIYKENINKEITIKYGKYTLHKGFLKETRIGKMAGYKIFENSTTGAEEIISNSQIVQNYINKK